MKSISLIIILVFSGTMFAQEIHTQPEHPKGNMSTQLEALPHYNEACELYQRQYIEQAKIALKEAINISFALTEAQLFLGQIFYEQNQLDSALYYLNSGIDFVIEQKPHYYFYLFETGMKMGEYDMVKHNLSHFKKLYGKTEGMYEKGHPFTVNDFQLYQESISMIYNYKSWIPAATIIGEEVTEFKNLTALGNDFISFGNGKSLIWRAKKGYTKSRRSKILFENAENIRFSTTGNLAFFSINKGNNADIYYALKKKRKWSDPIKLPQEVNSEHWDAYPFYSEKDSLLYFSSNRNGNKDLYVAKINLTLNTCSKLKPLSRINTEKDEIAPYFYNNTFYFASNGYPGFGGYDLYQTPDNEVLNGFLYPMNAYHMNYPYNTSKDELMISFANNGKHLIRRENYKQEINFLLMEPLPKKPKFNYDLRITKLESQD